MNRLIVATIAAGGLWSAPLAAHEGHVHASASETQWSTGARWSVGAFDFAPTTRGHWQTFSVGARWAPVAWLSADLSVPWGYLRLDDGRGAMGLSDIGGAVQAAHTRGPMRLDAGLGLGLPTGDPSVGLGAGHFDITPFANARFELTRALSVRFGAEHQEALTTTEDVAVPHGALLAPHANRETRATLAAAGRYQRVGAELRGTGVVSHDLPMGGTTAGAAFTFYPTNRWTLGAELELPVTGFRRNLWRSGINAAFDFN